MHNKKQKLTFFLVIQKYIDEDLFLPKIIKNLKEDISQKTRNAIKLKAKQTEINEDVNTIKILALFYCLHTQKPKHGYMSMFTKHLIKDTEIDWKPKSIKEMNDKVKQLIVDMGLPEMGGETKTLIKNVYYYKPDFIDKYPKLDSKIKDSE